MYPLIADYFSISFSIVTFLTGVFLFLRGRPGLERTLKMIVCFAGALTVFLDISYISRLFDTATGVNNISWFIICVVKTMALYTFGLLIYALVRQASTKTLFTLTTIAALLAYIILWPLTRSALFVSNIDLPRTTAEIALYLVYHLYAISLVTCVSGPLTWAKYREGNETVNAQARYGGVAAGAVLMGIYFLSRAMVALLMFAGLEGWAETFLAFSVYVVIGGGVLFGLLVLSKKHLVRLLTPFIWLRRIIWVRLLAHLHANLDAYCKSTTGAVVEAVTVRSLLKAETIDFFEYSLLIDILDKKRTLNGYLQASPATQSKLLEIGVIKPQIKQDLGFVVRSLSYLNVVDDHNVHDFDTLLKNYSRVATRLLFVR